jgi:ribosome maturation factor RimP
MTTQATDIKAGVDLARIRALLGPVLSARFPMKRVALVDLSWLTDQGGWILRITIEREGSTLDGGGVTLEDCADVSREASAVLDANEAGDGGGGELIPQHYHLEVSSPGLDRPLRTESELSRFVGRTVKVKLSHPAADGQRVLRGALDAAPAGRVAVIVDGKRVEVPFADVSDANLVFELAGHPKSHPKSQPKKQASKQGSKPSKQRSQKPSATRHAKAPPSERTASQKTQRRPASERGSS